MKKLLLIILLISPLKVFALADQAKSSILMDYNTGTILYEKNSNEKLPMASMTKMMSLLLIMEAIEDGRLHLDDDILISEKASSMGGSQAYLEANTTMKLDNLLKAICIASANDAVVAIAEKLYGSTSEFVNQMNKKSKELNLKNTNFKNVHGLDEKDHYSSAYDMAIIAKNLIKHEKILEYSSIYEDYINHANGVSTWIVNTNKLINYYEGLDGLKTGYTVNSGYCITATAKRNNLRLISVVMGEENNKQRNIDTMELLNYGFANYKIDKVISKKDYFDYIKVKFGNVDKAKVRLINDVEDLSQINEKNNYSYVLDTEEIIAPVKKGDTIGKVIVYENEVKIGDYPITVDKDIKKGNIFNYLYKNIMIYIKGYY